MTVPVSPYAPLQRWAEAQRGSQPEVALPLPVDRPLVEGVEVRTDVGVWRTCGMRDAARIARV